MKINKFVQRYISLCLIMALLIGVSPQQVFAGGLNSTTPKRTFDIQEKNYIFSARDDDKKYESRWEGIGPYAPLFGHMVNSGKYTRPLGRENGDLGWGWGSSDWLTGYVLVDLDSFGEIGTKGLLKDIYGLSPIGIVRVDDKYSRNDDFNSWAKSLQEAFLEYNGNLGFGEKGWGRDDAYQETKLVVWDGYKRKAGFDNKTGREFVEEVEDISSKNTVFRKEFCEYVKTHLENGAKLEGYINTSYGLKDVYEPTISLYNDGTKQISNIAQIKITGVSYEVELEHKNVPRGIDLPNIIRVKAGEKLELPSIEGYKAEVTYQDGKIFDLEFVEKNLTLIVNWIADKERAKEPFEDIGENYYKEPKSEDIVFDEETGLQYVKNQILISAFKGVDKSIIEEIVEEVNAEIVGYIELTNDYQVEFKDNKTLNEMAKVADYIDSYSFISDVTLNIVTPLKHKDFVFDELNVTNDLLYNDDKTCINDDYFDDNDKYVSVTGYNDIKDDWNESNPAGDNWGLEALYVPSAWGYKKEFNTVRIGIYDSGFDNSHEDLIFDDIANNPDVSKIGSHGTHVAGIMAAQHNNNKGVSGIATDTRLYAYALSGNDYGSAMGNKMAFAKLIGSHVKVINVSLGYLPEIIFAASHPEFTEEGSKKARKLIEDDAKILTEYLNKLISAGYDFNICVAAGNENNDKYVIDENTRYGIRKATDYDENENILDTGALAYYGSALSAITDYNLKRRIIVVGAFKNGVDRNFSLSNFSNVGSRVDFVAPGSKILSTVPEKYNSEKYALKSGTSMATPYISSLIAMMYQVNPGLKGSNIKTYIINSCKEYITDNGINYYIPDARGCYENAKNGFSGENDVSWPSGIVTGQTKSYDNKILSDVKITAIRKSTGEYNLGKYSFLFSSDNDGYYLQSLPQGIYDLIVSKEGYLPYVCNDIIVRPDDTTYVENIILSKWVSIFSNDSVKGNVKDALKGTPVDNAIVKLRKGWNNKEGTYCTNFFGVVRETKTDSNGYFSLSVKVGSYTAEIIKEGYVTAYYNVIAGPDGGLSVLSQTDMVLTPLLLDNEYRIILTWGNEPYDLDSHLTYYIGDEKKSHVFYRNKIAILNGEILAKLDFDDTSSYGPETITTIVNTTLFKEGNKFSYSVHDFLNKNSINSNKLSLSNATIHVYTGNKLLKTFSVPKNKNGTVWHVFDITEHGIKTFNNFYNCLDPSEVK